ncbi:TRAPP trafficking subunit Trs65-domain-containing protein [Xylaria bambusicola]|uniref:TRAPP trafficking subunit Trs65-domain-containing protein n=1 Tax=Xylaria bambusicola TaxID=326684 RepID=UPI0020071DF5|nr:TRAPP trafficking subunit Trs65-domain-containing protein [Xylaria bambusicola]KAI0526007.1 TRAPP trafficking subunit Trs65-domain-containing protein [Xylaria bambusicola]
MGDQSSRTTPQPALDLVENSTLRYFIPRDTDFAPGEFFKDGISSFVQGLASIEQRDSLFFDESVDMVFVLSIPYTDDDNLQATLKSLTISLETQIVNGSSSDRDGSPAAEVIYADTIVGSQDLPIITFHSVVDSTGDGVDSTSCTYLVWTKPVFLNRPRIRLQSPSAVFVATASVRPPLNPFSDKFQDDYMLSGTASSLNLLESFRNDLALGGIKPRLSALRVSRVAPLTQQANDLIRSIKPLSSLSLRIYPTVHSRIRFTHPNTTPATAAVIAMLEVDFTPFFDCEISLDKITLAIPDATVEDLTAEAGLCLPLSCVSHDHITFIYRINPRASDVASHNLMRDLDITISATALVSPSTKPQLKLVWTAAVDFTVPVNPGYGSTMQPIQRTHRPSQLSLGGESTTSLTAPSIARPDALPSLEASTSQTETSIQELGITVTFTAPSLSRKIFVGDEFSWHVLVVNQSRNQAAAARKLTMVAIPRRRRNESRVTRPPSVSRALDGLQKQTEFICDKNVAEAILDDNIVHAIQSSSVVDNAEVVCLSPDVRIGPLAPGTCHAAELKFLALKEGIVGIDAVRIIDLGNNEHVDIRHLPCITVENAMEIS